jgi:hypothetical protein
MIPTLVPRCLAAAVGLLLLGVAPALAHGGEAALIVEQNVAPPGGVVAVRGEDLGSEAQVRLALFGPRTVDLGAVTSDAEGHLFLAVAIPPDLPAGTYSLVATTAAGSTAFAGVIVDGQAVIDGQGGQGGRDEDDPLLVPLPPGWQQTLSSVPPLRPAVPAVPPRPPVSPDPPTPIVGLGLVALAGLSFGILSLRKGSRDRRAQA